MYKVLIVDADAHELNTLSRIINWEDCGLEIIGLLSDSRQALRFLEKHPTDILITNVRMPFMDGIALLQELRARNLHTRCILLANQEDFPYVPKAIPLDIENFLLKPLDRQLLLDTLLGTVQKIVHAQNQKHPVSNSLYGLGISENAGRGSSSVPVSHTFEKCMMNHEYAHCLAYLDSLFSGISSNTGATPAALQNHIVEIVVYIINVLRSCNIEIADVIGDHSDIFHKILSFQNMQDLYAWIKHFLTAAVDALESKNMHFSPCISRVVAHIEKNFAQDISLKTMAYELNINAAYLGQLFKAETGQLFSAYLNKIRIENAKKLLLNTNHTLSEVSLQCGYANISYFYNIFKKITGQTPSQYRKDKTE